MELPALHVRSKRDGAWYEVDMRMSRVTTVGPQKVLRVRKRGEEMVEDEQVELKDLYKRIRCASRMATEADQGLLREGLWVMGLANLRSGSKCWFDCEVVEKRQVHQGLGEIFHEIRVKWDTGSLPCSDEHPVNAWLGLDRPCVQILSHRNVDGHPKFKEWLATMEGRDIVQNKKAHLGGALTNEPLVVDLTTPPSSPAQDRPHKTLVNGIVHNLAKPLHQRKENEQFKHASARSIQPAAPPPQNGSVKTRASIEKSLGAVKGERNREVVDLLGEELSCNEDLDDANDFGGVKDGEEMTNGVVKEENGPAMEMASPSGARGVPHDNQCEAGPSAGGMGGSMADLGGSFGLNITSTSGQARRQGANGGSGLGMRYADGLGNPLHRLGRGGGGLVPHSQELTNLLAQESLGDIDNFGGGAQHRVDHPMGVQARMGHPIGQGIQAIDLTCEEGLPDAMEGIRRPVWGQGGGPHPMPGPVFRNPEMPPPHMGNFQAVRGMGQGLVPRLRAMGRGGFMPGPSGWQMGGRGGPHEHMYNMLMQSSNTQPMVHQALMMLNHYAEQGAANQGSQKESKKLNVEGQGGREEYRSDSMEGNRSLDVFSGEGDGMCEDDESELSEKMDLAGVSRLGILYLATSCFSEEVVGDPLQKVQGISVVEGDSIKRRRITWEDF